MPSPVGHLLAGATIAWASDLIPSRGQRVPPVKASVWQPGGTKTAICAGLAALADIDLLAGGHRTVTHSVGAAIVVGLVAAAIAAKMRGPVLRIALACGAAYGSHILLDWMGVDIWGPRGIKALWPFSDAWYVSGWDVFLQTERRRLLTLDTWLTNLRAFVREVEVLLPIAGAVWYARRAQRAREHARGDDAVPVSERARMLGGAER